jgi:Domain of unknown function (DUF1707)
MAVRREELRAGDSDRTFVAERLKVALDEGRLSVSDYDERLRQAYAATTYGDLDHVLADLPVTVDGNEAQLAPAGTYYPAQASTSWLAPLQTMPAWRVWFFGLWVLALAVLLVGAIAVASS